MDQMVEAQKEWGVFLRKSAKGRHTLVSQDGPEHLISESQWGRPDILEMDWSFKRAVTQMRTSVPLPEKNSKGV